MLNVRCGVETISKTKVVIRITRILTRSFGATMYFNMDVAQISMSEIVRHLSLGQPLRGKFRGLTTSAMQNGRVEINH